MRKKWLIILSVMVLALSGTFYFGNGKKTEAFTTAGEAQGFQYETGKYDLTAEQPFGGSNWNGNSKYVNSLSSEVQMFNITDYDHETINGNMTIDQNENIYFSTLDNNGNNRDSNKVYSITKNR